MAVKPKSKKQQYAGTYCYYLEWFMAGHNIRISPVYKAGDKWQWWWRDFEFERLFKEMHGKDVLWPTISCAQCDSRTPWFLGNMVKYGLITPRGDGHPCPEGYDVTEHGKEVYREWMEYLKEIGAKP